MDDKYKEEQSETRYPRRERYQVDQMTGYPVREERRPLRHSADSVRVPEETTKTDTFDTNIYQKEMELTEERTERSVRRERTNRSHSKRGQQRTNRSYKRRKKRKMSGLAKGLFVLVIALLVGCCSFFAMNHLMNPPEEEVKLTGQTVSITIPEGSGTEDIARILKENGLIKSVFSFKLTSKLDGFDGTYKQGTYAIDTGLTKRQIMELLQSGKVANDLKLTIPEGYTVKQIAETLEQEGYCSAEEFISECNSGSFDYDFLKDLPDRKYKLEGYLFPDTYFLTEGMDAHAIINMMLARFDQMYTKEYQDAVAASEYTLDEIVTIASMVEKEIKVADERPTAAGVIYNRLEERMSLGIDATVLYAVGKTSGELTAEDLSVDSPYNTRKNLGLPLGPIANPGEASFKAALYPEEHEYLYYVVEAAGKDNHVYCKTYDEFLNAKAAYTASLQ